MVFRSLVQAQKRMSEESLRVAAHLSDETGAPLSKLLYDVWVAAHYRAVARNEASGGPFLIMHDRVEELHRMYCLFIRVPGALEELKEVMKQCLDEYGTNLVQFAAHRGPCFSPLPCASFPYTFRIFTDGPGVPFCPALLNMETTARHSPRAGHDAERKSCSRTASLLMLCWLVVRRPRYSQRS